MGVSAAVVGVRPRRAPGVGWVLIASGLALIIAGEAPFVPASLDWLVLFTTLLVFLGMIPVARWLADGQPAHDGGTALGAARGMAGVGIAGMGAVSAAAVVATLGLLPVVPAAILDTSARGVVGLWLLVANAQALGARRFNRALAVVGALAGLSWLLAALAMWLELAIGAPGSLLTTLETIRHAGGDFFAELGYLLWALWLGIWLLLRRKR
ncbi:MAG TPA: hypothetical protein VGR57_17660 [Ktedonobacterales bacterium]|nr:hypothetical protein [Ktedonobacterales bacterium]